MIPDIAIGAVFAALITGAISFVGLIVSKEGKVSEFRQAWIDALRLELSTYLTNVNAVIRHEQQSGEVEEKNLKIFKCSWVN